MRCFLIQILFVGGDGEDFDFREALLRHGEGAMILCRATYILFELSVVEVEGVGRI